MHGGENVQSTRLVTLSFEQSGFSFPRLSVLSYLETIVISDGEAGTSSQIDTNGSETERESPSPHIAKRQRGTYSANPSIA
jgi:hypothetical protein